MATPPANARDRRLATARRIARVLDDRYVDPVLGFLLPGVGDVVSSAFGLYLIGVAIRHDLPLSLVARMLINLAVDGIVGAIPIVGDIFDLAFKANRRNLALLNAHHLSLRSNRGDRIYVAVAAMLALLALTVPIYVLFRLLAWLT